MLNNGISPLDVAFKLQQLKLSQSKIRETIDELIKDNRELTINENILFNMLSY